MTSLGICSLLEEGFPDKVIDSFKEYTGGSESSSHGTRDRSPIEEAPSTHDIAIPGVELDTDIESLENTITDEPAAANANATDLGHEPTSIRLGLNIDRDIVIAVLRALKESDTMCGLQMDYLQIVGDMYCKSDSEKLKKWPYL
uniref:Uncharacterized protein n=1 Tax=Amphimedon queenslandica TaxID=400682 RepID=A0A1X7V2R3_AMPQE